MSWLTGAFSIVGNLLGMGGDYLKGKREEQKLVQQHKCKMQEAKTASDLKRLETAQSGDLAWERLSLQNAGFKDDYLLILFSIPLIMSFIPSLAPYVEEGFRVLAGLPDIYRYSLYLMVGGSYGHKKILSFVQTKKGD